MLATRRQRTPAIPTIPSTFLRHLAVKVLQHRRDESVSIALGALGAGAGTTTVTENLARVLREEMGQRVVIVAVSPTRHTTPQSRQTELLEGAASSDRAILWDGQREASDTPGEAQMLPLRSELPVIRPLEIAPVIMAMRARFDVVLLDCAPLVEHPETALIAANVDGFVLVLQTDITRREAGRQMVSMLQSSGVPVLGSILNQMPRQLPRWLERFL